MRRVMPMPALAMPDKAFLDGRHLSLHAVLLHGGAGNHIFVVNADQVRALHGRSGEGANSTQLARVDGAMPAPRCTPARHEFDKRPRQLA